jgi:hypothetical protein
VWDFWETDVTRNRVIQRLCALQYIVHKDVIGFDHAADCFCGKGGMWESESYTESEYRNDGAVLEWIEKVVTDAIAKELSARGAAI